MTTTTDRATLETSLARIMALREQRDAIVDELEELETPLRAELERDPTPLVDGEHGIVATLRERKRPAGIDLISAARQSENDVHILDAALMGLLSARLTPLRQQAGKAACADALLRYEQPGGVTHTLCIERGA